jgi:hypothetical protein
VRIDSTEIRARRRFALKDAALHRRDEDGMGADEASVPLCETVRSRLFVHVAVRILGVLSPPMAAHLHRGRRAAAIENSDLRVTVLEEGGHIAEVFDKRTGINPLWTPPWPSIEPSAFDATRHVEYGGGADAKLLAGIMGHNWCLDIFGPPSNEELAAGLGPHGEASVARYDVEAAADRLSMRARFPLAELRVERHVALERRSVRIQETVESLSSCDRPVGWTQHVTLGPPFLQKGVTEFRASATRSKVFESAFGSADYLQPGAVFEWPIAPRSNGGVADLRVFTDASSSSAYTAHLMDKQRRDAFFVAFKADARLAFGYVWAQSDFPWLGIWEENRSRRHLPWNGRALTRGLEFGVSPFPESRRQMVDRNSLFGTPTYRWIPARDRITVEYWIIVRSADAIPEALERP